MENKSKSKKAFIFDFDGTIADTLPVFLNIFKLSKFKVFLNNKQVGDSLHPEKIRSTPLDTLIKEFEIAAYKLPFLLLLFRYELSRNIEKVHPFLGIREVIKEIIQSGHIVGVLTTNSRANVRKFMELNDFPKPAFVYAENALFGKDKALIGILKKEKLRDFEVYYIGDEGRDIAAAKKAGIKSVGVSWGYANEDLLRESNPDYLYIREQDLLNLC